MAKIYVKGLLHALLLEHRANCTLGRKKCLTEGMVQDAKDRVDELEEKAWRYDELG